MGRLAVFKLMYLISILGTFAIAVLTILGIVASYANPNSHPGMAFIGLALPALLIINVILIFYWTIRWRRWVWVPVIAILCNFNYISSVYQLSFSTPQPAGNTVKILTCNIHNFNDEITGYTAKEIERYMQDNQIDIICFQEFAANEDFTLDSLSNVFKKYPYQKVRSQLAVYSRYPIEKSLFIPFDDTNNCGMWTDIRIKDKTIRLFNVHMQTTNVNQTRNFSAKRKLETLATNFKMRARQSNLISYMIRTSPYPVILCGDFNDIPSSYTYRQLKGNLEDGFKTSGSGYEYTFRNIYSFLRIDYIFYDPSMTGINYYSHSIDWSDHNPVIMELGL